MVFVESVHQMKCDIREKAGKVVLKIDVKKLMIGLVEGKRLRVRWFSFFLRKMEKINFYVSWINPLLGDVRPYYHTSLYRAERD